MLARIRTMQEKEERGFTLIELLVVMIIIGILAAIAIPTFLNQKKNAYNTATKSDITNASQAIESMAVDNNGSYSFLTANHLVSADVTGFTDTAGVTVTTTTASASGYCLTGTNTNSAASYYYDSTVGSITAVDASHHC